MVGNKELTQRTLEAINIKFCARSRVLANSLDELERSIPYGVDASLSSVLNCTIGGAGPQPLEAEVIAAADQASKKAALQLVINQLFKLRDEQVLTEKVSVVISKLQAIVS
jgi:hypothetical protein